MRSDKRRLGPSKELGADVNNLLFRRRHAKVRRKLRRGVHLTGTHLWRVNIWSSKIFLKGLFDSVPWLARSYRVVASMRIRLRLRFTVWIHRGHLVSIVFLKWRLRICCRPAFDLRYLGWALLHFREPKRIGDSEFLFDGFSDGEKFVFFSEISTPQMYLAGAAGLGASGLN